MLEVEVEVEAQVVKDDEGQKLFEGGRRRKL
jgi:hypothetical protein